MQIAVTRVEHIHHEDVVLLRDRVHLVEHFDEPSAGNDSVVQVVIRLDAGDGANGRFAPLPQQRPLGIIGGDADGASAVGTGDVAHCLCVVLDPAGQSVDFDEQNCRGVGGVSGGTYRSHRGPITSKCIGAQVPRHTSPRSPTTASASPC